MKKNLLLPMAILSLFTVSCSKESDTDKVDNSIKLGKNEYTLNYEQKVQIEATSTSKISYDSESEYVAEVSETGLITGGRVGKTNIILNNGEDTKKVEVNIKPKYNLFPEPIEKIKFGATAQEVKKAFGSNPIIEDSETILYQNYSSFYDYLFGFKNGKLESMIVICELLEAPLTIGDFLNERYEPAAKVDEYVYGFMNEKEDLVILYSFKKEVFVGYALNTKTNSMESLLKVYEKKRLNLLK